MRLSGLLRNIAGSGLASKPVTVKKVSDGSTVASTTTDGSGAWSVDLTMNPAGRLYWESTDGATTRRSSSAAIGTFGFVSALLSLLCHALLEPAVSLSARDLGLIAVLGLGPLGGAFFLWDAALKLGDARQIGVLSYLTPLLSTLTLLWATGRPLTGSIVLATALILGAAVIGTRAR